MKWIPQLLKFMETKIKLLLSLAICILTISCSGEANSESEEVDADENLNNTELIEDSTNINNPDFVSPIRPEMTDFVVGEEYEDELIFDHVDHDFDYWYSVFKTSNGEEVYMIEGVDYEAPPKGSIVNVKWTIDLFDEAGDDYSYYDELILDLEIISEGQPVADWLSDGFIDDLLKNDLDLLKKYLHEEQESVYTSYNPGAYCVLGGGGYLPDFSPDFSNGRSVVKGYPEGDMCIGYEGASAGFYYEVVESEADLPEFADMSGDQEMFSTITPPQPAGGADATYKVIVISEEYQYATIYILELYGEYYLWLIDYCDCSA